MAITAAEKMDALAGLKGVGELLALVHSGSLALDADAYSSAIARIGKAMAIVERVEAKVVKSPLLLERTDQGSSRVYYKEPCGLLYCFELESPRSFTLYLCTADGKPSVQVDAAAFELDAIPMGDSSVAASFRSFRAKAGIGLADEGFEG
jgi:hypothetical protein